MISQPLWAFWIEVIAAIATIIASAIAVFVAIARNADLFSNALWTLGEWLKQLGILVGTIIAGGVGTIVVIAIIGRFGAISSLHP